MENLINTFKDINNNQLLVMLFSGGVIWTLLSNIRAIFSGICNAILSCISFTVSSVDVGDYDRPVLFYKIEKVLSESKVLWERHTEIHPSSSAYNETKLMNVAYGRSYRWIWGHLMILDREYSTQSTKVVINTTARIFFARRKKFIKRMMGEIERCQMNKDRNTVIVNAGNGIITEKPKRFIDSVYSDGNVAQSMLNDVKAFLSNREIYNRNNTPYKFVGLLCGTPGSGKTSSIHAIASELGMGIRFVNIDKEDFESIARIMTFNTDCNNSDDRNIIVIEDIDCMSMGADEKRCGELIRKESEENVPIGRNGEKPYTIDVKAPSISLSSILNLLDGIITPSGVIVFLTTNKPENLDAALLRDGRIDARYDFGDFSSKTALKMVKELLGFDFKEIKDGITPSSLQRDILKVSIGRMSKADFVSKYSVDGERNLGLPNRS